MIIIAEFISPNILQARKLEAQLDEQMNAYRKLVSANASTKVDGAESDVESWIERLLKQLQQVNSQMQALVSSGGSDMVSHTLTRHQEILRDLTQVFDFHSLTLCYLIPFCVSICLCGGRFHYFELLSVCIALNTTNVSHTDNI